MSQNGFDVEIQGYAFRYKSNSRLGILIDQQAALNRLVLKRNVPIS